MQDEYINEIARLVAEALSALTPAETTTVKESPPAAKAVDPNQTIVMQQGGGELSSAEKTDALEQDRHVSALEDLGCISCRGVTPIKDPLNRPVLEEFLHVTRARVAVGKAGPRPNTLSYLRFLADHARSKDTVIKEVTPEWLQKCGLWSICTEAEDKHAYLTRPDLGRILSDEAIRQLKQRYSQPVQVQLILSDGLSTDALLSNYEEILPPLLNGLKTMGITVAEPFFLRHGRVKAEDVIGEVLGCDVVVLLIGERPGLGQSESMSCYAVYRPTRATLESERTVISNIHAGGTPPVEAAAVIADLVARMLKYKCSGIKLNQVQSEAG